MSKKQIRFFYTSDFIMSTALGMIPLMTVLSFFVSSLSSSSIAYALVLALYNIATTLPKMFVAKNLVNRSNTFDVVLVMRFFQLLVWLMLGIGISISSSKFTSVIVLVVLYLLYASIKGATEVLNIDVYSRVINGKNIGKFFGYKNSFNSLAEFIGAISLVYIFKFLNIDMNYSLIFMGVFTLDLFSYIVLLCSRKFVNKELRNVGNISKKKENLFEITSKYSNADINPKDHWLIKNLKDISYIVKNDSVFKVFLIANVVSIVGASVASFYIPHGTQVLNLTIEAVSVANAIWLVSKVVSSILWGYISDGVGAKYVLIGSRAMLFMSYVIAVKLSSLNGFYLMLILHGISSSALVIMSQKIFLEISTDRAPLYAAINSIVCMPFFVVMPLISSYIGEAYSFEFAFIISTIPLLVSLFIMVFKFNIEKEARV